MLADKTKQADTMTNLLTKVQFLSDQVESTPENLKHIIASQYEPSERLKRELADLKAENGRLQADSLMLTKADAWYKSQGIDKFEKFLTLFRAAPAGPPWRDPSTHN